MLDLRTKNELSELRLKDSDDFVNIHSSEHFYQPKFGSEVTCCCSLGETLEELVLTMDAGI